MSKILSEHNYNGIDATIIADSKNEFGQRITSFVCTFPRMILAEAKTHRIISGLGEQVEVSQSIGLNDEFQFSRNSASSRAVPFKTMLERVENNPFIPIAWQKDHKGMQGTEYFTDPAEIAMLRYDWLGARDSAMSHAEKQSNNEITKQLCNRLLEPFMWHTAIITATEWENFFHLRCPSYYDGNTTHRSKKDYCKANNSELKKYSDSYWYAINEGQGEIHIMALAEAMWDAMNESEPKQLKAGEWHIPFGDDFDENKLIKLHYNLVGKEGREHNDEEVDLTDLLIKIATARCARVSYLNFEGKDDYEADIKLHDRLSSMGHWSPFEHCGRAMSKQEWYSNVRSSEMLPLFAPPTIEHEKGVGFQQIYGEKNDKNFGWSGNFQGFIQYRKMFKDENVI